MIKKNFTFTFFFYLQIMLRITNQYNNNCKKFNCKQHVIEISFDSVDKTFGESQKELDTIFTNIHLKIMSLMQGKCYARITFLHDDFDHPIGKIKIYIFF